MSDGPLERLQRHAFQNYIPLYTTIELTLKCNLRCVHCYNFDRETPAPKFLGERPFSEELKSQEILEIIDDLSHMGCFFLSFTGGEALLHPDLNEFVTRARMHHMVVRIKSNGTLFSPSRVRALIEAGAHDCDVSVYGATAGTHDAFTKQEGSFKATVLGIEEASSQGLRPYVSLILHRGNAHEYVQMLELCQSLKVEYGLSSDITIRYDGTESSKDERISFEQFKKISLGPGGQALLSVFNPEGNVQCACARSVLGISSTGEIYPCIGAPVPSGNVRRTPLTTIWRESSELNRIRELTPGDFPECGPCEDRFFCERSSGSMYVNQQDYQGKDSWLCDQARFRKENQV